MPRGPRFFVVATARRNAGLLIFPAHASGFCSVFLRTHGASNHSACVGLLTKWVATPPLSPPFRNLPFCIFRRLPSRTAVLLLLQTMFAVRLPCTSSRCSMDSTPVGPFCRPCLKAVARGGGKGDGVGSRRIRCSREPKSVGIGSLFAMLPHGGHIFLQEQGIAAAVHDHLLVLYTFPTHRWIDYLS